MIDEAVHLLDTPAEPWGIQLELAFPDRLDEDRLRDAVRQAAADHPMAMARQLPARRTDHTWMWEVAPDFDVDPVRVAPDAVGSRLAVIREDFYRRQVPLVESPPFRVLLAQGARGDRLLLHANHAAFDGYGCLRLLVAVARAYTGEPDPPAPVPLEEARQVRRLVEAPNRATKARRLRILAAKVADLGRPPARVAADEATDAPGYGFHHQALSPALTEQLAASDHTVNDLLLAALVRTVASWNEEHDAPAKRVGVLVPVNVRPAEWRTDVVTNLVLDSRVLVSGSATSDRETLLAAVTREATHIKEGGGAALMEAIGGWEAVPLWTKQPLSTALWLTGNRLVDTALLSNLGELDDPPDFGAAGTANEVWFSAPSRMPCGLSVGAATVGGRLLLSFRYRHPLLGGVAAARLASRFVEELGWVLGS